jgi:hypothetical protein
MRLALVSLMALAAGSNAFAQTTPAPADQAPPAAAPATPPAPAPAPAPTPPAATTPAPAPTPAPATTPAPAASAATPASPTAPSAPTDAAAGPGAAPAAVATEAPAPLAAPTPPPPPAPPTDPTAVALLAILQKVCIPAANGGNFVQIAKTNGLRKNNDNNWVIKTKDYTLTVEDPGSNPHQCHVDVTHPLDPDSPGKLIVVALNDWAAVENGWSLYRNDKSVQQGYLYTTRSWQLDWNGKEQSLVFTNMRKPDGTPLRNGVDTSQIIYGVEPSPSQG